MAKGNSKASGSRWATAFARQQQPTPPTPQPQQPQPTQPTQQPSNDGGDRGIWANMTYDDFMQLSEANRFKTIENIVADKNVKVPDYLDPSTATKIVYALGMTNKPQVVDDATLDGMKGREMFRGVYDGKHGITADDIADQIQSGDYTQFSNSGGSAYGRGLYFTGKFGEAQNYANGGYNPTVLRVKIAAGAKMVKASTLENQMNAKGFNPKGVSSTDRRAAYAISQGISGWYDDSGWSGGYTIMVDRGALVMSKTRKKGNYSSSSWAGATSK